jgi:hypothetical protein
LQAFVGACCVHEIKADNEVVSLLCVHGWWVFGQHLSCKDQSLKLQSVGASCGYQATRNIG